MPRAAGQGLLGLPWEFLSHLNDQLSVRVCHNILPRQGRGDWQAEKRQKSAACGAIRARDQKRPGDEEMNYGRPGELDYREVRQDRAGKIILCRGGGLMK